MPLSASICRLFACASCLWSVVGVGVAFGAIPQADYDALILAARNGQTAPAIEQLRQWHAAYPADKRVVHDLATILDRAGQYAAALQFQPQILSADAPAYAIKAIAHAARSAGRAADAETAYQLLISKTPKDGEAHAGLVYAWMAQDRLQEAQAYAVGKLPQSPVAYSRSDVALLVALAELQERRGEWLAAASVFQEVSRLEPDFRFALRGRVFALGRAGLPFLARRLADRHADAFSAEENARLTQDVVAHMVRYGQAQAAADTGARRFASADAALAANAALAGDFRANPAAHLDRLVALSQRTRMQEAVDLFEAMHAQQIAMPSYARFAAADAYMYLQRPQDARELYLDGLRQLEAIDSMETLAAQIALVYAYNEAEQHDEAEKRAQQLLTVTQKKMHAGLRGLEAPNPEYTRVYLLNAVLSLYNDRLAQAETRLGQLRAMAPFNADIRMAWASLQAAREHPRAAFDEYTLLLVDQPASRDAAVGRAEILLSMDELAAAKAALPGLVAESPENTGVRRLARRLENYERPYFRAAATVGRGAAALGAESIYETALYSAPLSASLGERFRIFSHAARANGANQENGESRTRMAVGVDYREQDFTAEAAVTRSTGALGVVGAALKLSRSLSDTWRAGVEVDTNVVDLPAAAMREGVQGKSLKLGLTWILNESRQAGGDSQRLRYSDGNVRDSVALWWKERWIAGPAFKFDTALSLATTDNSPGARAYFNPDRDAELSLQLVGEWLSWRHYQRWLKQRVVLGLGHYWQSSYGSGRTANLRYEHEWSRDDTLGLQYGIGRSFQPYDGIRGYRSYLYVSLFGRF